MVLAVPEAELHDAACCPSRLLLSPQLRPLLCLCHWAEFGRFLSEAFAGSLGLAHSRDAGKSKESVFGPGSSCVCLPLGFKFKGF